MFYALLDKDGTALRKMQADKQPADLPHKGWRWVPVIDEPPPHDPATELVVMVAEEVQADRLVKVYEVQAKPASAPTIEDRLKALEKAVFK